MSRAPSPLTPDAVHGFLHASIRLKPHAAVAACRVMLPHQLLYYITDRSQFPGDEPTRRRLLLKKISQAAEAGVDYIQLREKDLPSRELEALAGDAIRVMREAQLQAGSRKRRIALLLNSRTDIAAAVGADGVHLRSDDISPAEVRRILAHSSSTGAPASPMISISCHTPEQVQQAQLAGADLALFAPVFEKRNSPLVHAAGLEALRRACQHKIPVFAMGGVTLENASACLEAGAAGIAGIRLFQENPMSDVVRQLRRP